MTFKIELLNLNNESAYNHFLQKENASLLYYSTFYKKLLEKHILSESYYFLGVNNQDEVIGCFPLMIIENKKLGKVANSLPYYGSNGSILYDTSLSEATKSQLFSSLTNSVLKKIKSEECVSATFVSNPFLPEISKWFKAHLKFDYSDYRIGQITKLPAFNNELDLDQSLMSVFSNPRPRNIKKAKKSGITVRFSNNNADIEFLYKVHKDNIEAIGGKSKTMDFFENVLEIIPSDNYKVLIAELDEKPIAGLLIFYFNNTIEYFTPATITEHRNLQPSSLLIFEGMKDGIRNGYTYWNWGGTWGSQDGVYDFKKKWGAENYNYEYYTMLYDKSLLNLSSDELTQQFNHTFVFPFDQLKKR